MKASQERIVGAGFFLLACVAGSSQADVKLPAIIGEHMVLQRGVAVPIWGWADPGEQVTARIAGQAQTATPDAKGNWVLKLDAMRAGGPHTMTITGKNALTVRNILVGDVWLCSGQSNMAMTVGGASNAQQEVAAANFPKIRHFRVGRVMAPTPQSDCKGVWVECSPTTAGAFTATGYFFGRDLHRHLNVPIGLINSSVGGTPIEAWTRRQVLQGDPALEPIMRPWQERLESFDPEKARKDYENRLAKWQEAAAKARAAGKRPPRRPQLADPARSGQCPGSLYNGMIAPLIPFAIRGAIWYQGERNCRNGSAYLYRQLLPAMIQSWRKDWGQGQFPFLYVQLPNWRGHNPGVEDWAVIRESMLQALKTPGTGMAVTIDLGDPGNIHPRNKQDVGKRLALAARAVAYGEPLCYSGPMYESMKVEGSKARVRFRHLGGGLAARNGPLKGFMVAGNDRKFVAARAEIEGDEVAAWSAGVAAPVAVRYGWANNPECNLYNKAGLPAAPFRTDTWPVPGEPGADIPK